MLNQTIWEMLEDDHDELQTWYITSGPQLTWSRSYVEEEGN